ncbi:hypothetical protein COHA_010859 [Chlorella ohadii]|uniref:Uncharacterized protein n=1 Tax=Chlorella ohadii TaxID=2649997 RepID=A0AAD5DFI3_9CHLO|nr:hypothetical protein COHA_010859 [Chlorella ohadii]
MGGFDYSGGAWNTLVGKPGAYLLYNDGAGVRIDAQIVAAAGNPKALFIQAVTLTRGAVRTTTTLSKVGTQWQTTVLAMGKKVLPNPPAVIGGNITVRALLKNGKTGGVFITLPYLSLRCEQMWPTKPQHAGFPNWFDCYFTVLQPLPQPTGGLLGSTYRPPPVGAAAVAAKQPAASAAFVFEEN